MKNKIGFIFDFDGTLVDTDSINYEIFRIIIHDKRKNISIDEIRESTDSIIGRNFKQIVETLNTNYQLNLNLREFATQFKFLKKQFSKFITTNPTNGSIFTLKKLIELNIPFIISSNNTLENIIKSLTELEIQELIDLNQIFSAHDYKKFKPSPELHLIGAKKIEEENDIEKIYVIEDSATGIDSALSAQFRNSKISTLAFNNGKNISTIEKYPKVTNLSNMMDILELIQY